MDWLSRIASAFPERCGDARSLILVPIFLLGFPQNTIFAYLIFVSVQSTLIHSNIRMNAGWLRYVVVTPQFVHHWHHMPRTPRRSTTKNSYRAHRRCGTSCSGHGVRRRTIGQSQYGTVKPVPGGIVGQLLYPITVAPDAEAFRQH